MAEGNLKSFRRQLGHSGLARRGRTSGTCTCSSWRWGPAVPSPWTVSLLSAPLRRFSSRCRPTQIPDVGASNPTACGHRSFKLLTQQPYLPLPLQIRLLLLCSGVSFSWLDISDQCIKILALFQKKSTFGQKTEKKQKNHHPHQAGISWCHGGIL